MQENQETTELDLRELLYMMLRRWYLILGCVLVASGIAYYVSWYVTAPVYRAEASLFLGKERDTIGGISLSDMSLNNQLLADYRELLKSRMVVDQVIEEMDLDMDYREFSQRVGTNMLSDSRMFRISFRSTNPQLAADAVNRLSLVLMSKAGEVINVKNIQVIDVALVPEVPVEPSKMRNLFIAAVLGGMMGVFIVFIMEFLDRTFKKPEDIERLLGLTVLGTVPRFAGEKREKPSRRHHRKQKKHSAA